MPRDRKAARTEGADRPLWQRLAWLVLLWSLSVGTLAVVAFVLRLIMASAGLSTPD